MKYLLMIFILIITISLFPAQHGFWETIDGEKFFVSMSTTQLTENIAIDHTNTDHFFVWRHPRFSDVYFFAWGEVAGVSTDDMYDASDFAVMQYNSITLNDDIELYNVDYGTYTYIITITFMSDPYWFPDPEETLAVTLYSLPLPENNIMDPVQIMIFLNCSDEFYLNLQWNQNSAVWVDYQSVIIHEISHALGIDHISEFPPEADPVMQETIPENTFRRYLDNYDTFSYKALYSEGTGTSYDNNQISTAFKIYNYPNPFNPSTTISYNLAENISDPEIEIYNIKGQKVKSFQLEDKAGESSIVWNGKDENDKSVSSGVYFYRLVNEGKTVQSRKMLLMK